MILIPTMELKWINVKVMEHLYSSGSGDFTAWNGDWTRVLHQKFIDSNGKSEWIPVPGE